MSLEKECFWRKLLGFWEAVEECPLEVLEDWLLVGDPLAVVDCLGAHVELRIAGRPVQGTEFYWFDHG